jgi:hypothetical protein
MSERFGLSHRQVVRDVNEGKVVDSTGAAPSSARGVGAVRPGRQDKSVDIDHGSSDRLVQSLVRATGKVGGAIAKEQERKQIIAGYNWAGTEAGRKEVEEASGTLAAKLFGPNPKLRSAQERIVKDQTDAAASKLLLDLDDFGHKMTEKEWQEHAAKTLVQRLERFEDDGIKDQITQRFGQNLSAISREYTKQNHLFLQNEERETFMDSVGNTSRMAHNDFASGDPNRLFDGGQRLREVLTKPEGMTDEAYHSALATVIKRDLADGRGGLYLAAKDAGILDGFDFKDRDDLQTQWDLFNVQNDETMIRTVDDLMYLAENGEDHEEQVFNMAQRLFQVNPEAFGRAGIAGVMDKAFARQRAVEAERRARFAREQMARSGDPALLRSSPDERQQAVEDGLNTAADHAIRTEMQHHADRNGFPYDAEMQVTQGQRDQWLLENPDKWGRTWASNGVPVDQVGQMGRMIVNHIDRLDLTEETAQELKSNLDSMMQLRQFSPDLWSKQFTSEEATRMLAYHEEMNISNADPFAAVQRLRDIEARRLSGQTFEAKPGEIRQGVEAVGKAFVREHGEWSINPLRHAAGFLLGTGRATVELAKKPIPFVEGDLGKAVVTYKNLTKLDPDLKQDLDLRAERFYEQEFERTGDDRMARAYATSQLNKGSTVIGGRFVLDGARLDENSINGDFEHYLEGLNDDQEFRRRATGKEYGLPADVDIARDIVSVRAYPDGTGATLQYLAEDGSLRVLPINVPTRPEDLRPTDSEKVRATLRKNLLESRAGGSFGVVFSEAERQAEAERNQQ